jgi:hypothetical protein
MGQSGDVPRAGLAVVDALRNSAVDAAHRLDERLLRRIGVTSLDRSVDTLHTGPHMGANVAVAGGALDRLPDSLFC